MGEAIKIKLNTVPATDEAAQKEIKTKGYEAYVRAVKAVTAVENRKVDIIKYGSVLNRELQNGNETIKRLLEREDVQEALRQLEVMMPFMQMLLEELSGDSPIWKYPMHIMTRSVQAYIDINSLHDADADTVEAQRAPFVAFIKTLIDECQAIEKADPNALHGPAGFEALKKALAKKGLVSSIKAQPQPSAEVLEALAIGYSYLRQGPVTNSLAKINTKTRGSVFINPITGTATAKSGDLTVMIENFQLLAKGLETSTHQLFDLLMCQFTHSGGDNPVIQIPLKEYMTKRGLKDPKEAREQVKADLEALRNIFLEFTDKRGAFFRAYLFGGEMGIKNSVITFSISRSFFELLEGKDYAAMPIPDALFQVDSRHYIHAYGIGRALNVHKRINAGKPNERRISVKSLLSSCPALPRYEALDKSKGEISRKIIEPFEKNLNHLEDRNIIEWAYCHGRGEPLTAAEEDRAARGMPYTLFSKLYIQFDVKGYPDQTKLLAARKKRAKQAERKKQNERSAKVSEPH